MMKFIDLVAYPVMLLVVYVLFGFINWERDPNLWSYVDRCLWVAWGLLWGWALQLRINRGGAAWTLT
jgi:hypothetical protein